MELEQRVKSLEFEMKILKNEVQRTLLDIQEQILIHYYPSLRAQEPVPVQVMESVRQKQQQLEASNPSGVREAPGLSEVMQVSLDDVKVTQREALISEGEEQEE